VGGGGGGGGGKGGVVGGAWGWGWRGGGDGGGGGLWGGGGGGTVGMAPGRALFNLPPDLFPAIGETATDGQSAPQYRHMKGERQDGRQDQTVRFPGGRSAGGGPGQGQTKK